ncbi:hypothetical protein HYU18_02830 [Candidatus Woesearchaeota archaeon]|nr:hypothetical protein [Candidatus Woesearchaeota archaeon]
MTDFVLMFRGRDEPEGGDIRYDLCDLVQRHLPDAEENGGAHNGVWRFPGRDSENHMTDWYDGNGGVVISFRSVVYRRERWGVVVSYRTEEVPQALLVMQGLLETYKPITLMEAPRPLRLYYFAMGRAQQPLSEEFYGSALSELLSSFSGKPVM